MSVTQFVISFVFMAVATMTILVVGTLGAADLLHRRHRSDEAEEGSDSSHLEDQAGAKARRDSQSEAAAERNADVVDALMPLGSSLTFVRHPKSAGPVNPDGDHEDPTHGRAA
jgi:hypothetical protein